MEEGVVDVQAEGCSIVGQHDNQKVPAIRANLADQFFC